MSAARFNAITYSKKLQAAGLHKDIADVQAEEMSVIINNDLVTKQDLLNLEVRLKNEIIIKLGSITIACTAVLGIILKWT